MVSFIYNLPGINYLVNLNYSLVLRPTFNFLNTVHYHVYLMAGSKPPRALKKLQECVLSIEVLRGRDLPYHHLITGSKTQYIFIRIGHDSDYCLPILNKDGQVTFDLTSYFVNKTLTANEWLEISLLKDGRYVDSVVGTVMIPIIELYTVRTYDGWVSLKNNDGDPVGFIYVSCNFRKDGDRGYEILKSEADRALGPGGDQILRQQRGRNTRETDEDSEDEDMPKSKESPQQSHSVDINIS